MCKANNFSIIAEYKIREFSERLSHVAYSLTHSLSHTSNGLWVACWKRKQNYVKFPTKSEMRSLRCVCFVRNIIYKLYEKYTLCFWLISDPWAAEYAKVCAFVLFSMVLVRLLFSLMRLCSERMVNPWKRNINWQKSLRQRQNIIFIMFDGITFMMLA